MTNSITYASEGAGVPFNTEQATDFDTDYGHMPIVKLGVNSGAGLVPAVAATGIVTTSLDPSLATSLSGALVGKTAYVLHIMGRRDLGWSATTDLGDCVQYLDTTQNLINDVAVGTTYYIVSTSTSDGSLASGARTVRIVYLDSDGAQQVTTATMDGTTPVSLGVGFTAFQWMEVASLGSDEVSVGDIAITSNNGAAAPANTVEFIKAGGNRSLSGRYTVPTGYSAYLLHWDANAISAAMDARLRATVFANDRSLSTVYHFQDTLYLASGANAGSEKNSLKFPAGCAMKVSAIPAQAPAANRLDTSFGLLLVSNA
jgi:hypothetical protein